MDKIHKGITVLVDMDDTIENLVEAWVKWLDEKYGLNVQPEDITEWDIHKFFPNLTREQVFEPMFIDDFWWTVRPKVDAMYYLKKLQDEDVQIYICTATDYKSIRPKTECILNRFFPYISWDHVIVSSNKQIVNADILIDDAPHNLEGGSFVKILFDTPHNRNYDAENNGMYRVKNWEEIYDILSGVNENLNR